MESGARSYEFDSAQNEQIGVLARRMTWVGRFMIVFSIIAVFAGVIEIRNDGAGAIIQGLILLIIAIWTVRAAAAFSRITTTEGSDISNLMEALHELRKLYTLQYYAILVAIIFVVIAMVIGAFWLVA